MKLHDFEHFFCINLKTRTDRKIYCESIFSNLNLSVTFFDAIDGKSINTNSPINKGNVGCCLSHYNIWKIIKKNNWKKVLIMEDDVQFHSDVLNLFEKFYKEVPLDWNLLYFGGNHCKQKLNFISDHIHKLKQTYTTHCYAVTDKAIDYLLNKFNEQNILNHEIDVNLSKIQNEIPSYGFYPHLAWQKEGISDIENRYVDYSFLKKHE